MEIVVVSYHSLQFQQLERFHLDFCPPSGDAIKNMLEKCEKHFSNFFVSQILINFTQISHVG